MTDPEDSIRHRTSHQKCACNSLVITLMLISAIIIPACSSLPPYTSAISEGDGSYEIPLSITESGELCVTLDSSIGPLDLMLDTGADQPLLLYENQELSKSMPALGREWSGHADGTVKNRRVHSLAELKLGHVLFTDVATTFIQKDGSASSTLDGLLGRRLFGLSTLDIDAPNGRLAVYPPGTLPEGISKYPDSWIMIPIKEFKSGPVVVANLNSNTTRFNILLDTGAIATGKQGFYGIIELPDGLTSTQEIPGSPPVVDQAVLSFTDSAKFGPIPMYVIKYPDPPGIDGFLGNVLFASNRVVIDPSGKSLYIQSE